MRILLYVLLVFTLTNCSQTVNQPVATKSVSAFPAKLPIKYNDMHTMLVRQIRVDELQRKLLDVENLQRRKWLQMSIDQYQKKINATANDYQRLLRRIVTTHKIELLAYDDLEVDDRTPSHRTAPHRKPVVVKAVGPPPKSIMVSMPGSPLGTLPKPGPEVITTKSGTTYPRFPLVNQKGAGAIKSIKSSGTPK